MEAPENTERTPSCDRTDASSVPFGSSSFSRQKGSVQPRLVVNLPGTGSNGHVRIQRSAVPVLLPNVKGATRRETTVVEGTAKPRESASSKPNALSPRNR